jgi:hypothetical protein
MSGFSDYRLLAPDKRGLQSGATARGNLHVASLVLVLLASYTTLSATTGVTTAHWWPR